MGDIILDDITHEERRQVNTHHRINQIEPVGTSPVERTGEQQDNLVDNPMKRECSDSSEETHDESKRQEEHSVAHMCHSPFMKALQHRRF